MSRKFRLAKGSFKAFLTKARKPVLAAMVLGGPLLAAPAAFAGRLPGPGIDHERAEAYSSVRYTDMFRGGETAVITVCGDGDTDLDVFVYDENGNLITRTSGPGDECVVRFRPRWTGRFTVVIRNNGGVYNTYTLRTN